MSTIDELKRENKKLKDSLKAKKELIEIQRERNKLLRENKQLMRKQKYGGLYSTGEKVKSASARAGKIAGKTGKAVWNILRKLEEERLKNEALRKRIMRAGGKSPSRKTKRKKRR